MPSLACERLPCIKTIWATALGEELVYNSEPNHDGDRIL